MTRRTRNTPNEKNQQKRETEIRYTKNGDRLIRYKKKLNLNYYGQKNTLATYISYANLSKTTPSALPHHAKKDYSGTYNRKKK